MIGYKDIQSKLKNIWPHLDQIWCFDQEYIEISIQGVEDFLNDGGWFSLSEITSPDVDCDDFALQQHAKVKRHFNWPFGESFANKVRGWSSLHSLNICVCKDGVILVDSKQRTIWQPINMQDNILWVRL